ncbi:MAG: nucleotidyltransferase family protein [Halioglobus sp.]
MPFDDKKPLAVASIVLAAGRSSRMGEQHKLLAQVAKASLVTRVVNASLQSDLVSTSVVVGHRAQDLKNELLGKEVVFVNSPNYKRGLAESLKAGLASLPTGIDGVMILLADMPFITFEHINTLILEFKPLAQRHIVVPKWQGRRGNPVIWPMHYIPEMMQLSGDRGARSLLHVFSENVHSVAMPTDAVLVDVDTPAQLDCAQARGVVTITRCS